VGRPVGDDQLSRFSHTRWSDGLVCETGLLDPSFSPEKSAGFVIPLSRYITPVPRPSSALDVALAAATTNTPHATTAVPEGKIWLVTHISFAAALTALSTIVLQVRRRTAVIPSSGLIASARRDAQTGLWTVEINKTCRIWLRHTEIIQFVAVTGAGGVGLANCGVDAYEFCAGVWPGV